MPKLGGKLRNKTDSLNTRESFFGTPEDVFGFQEDVADMTQEILLGGSEAVDISEGREDDADYGESIDNVGIYFNEMGRTPLLTQDEERELGISIHRFMQLEKSLFRKVLNGTLMFSPNKKTEELITDARIIAKDIGKSDKDFEKILSKRREFFKRLKNGEIELIMDSEKKDMFSKIRTRGEIAIEKLTTANLRLVVSIAKSYIKRNRGNFLLLDIIQAGNIGLMKAVRKFNPTKFDNKFSTLASSWIRQSVDISIRNTGHMIRIAAHETENIRELRKIQVAFHKEFLRYPTSEELAKYLEVSEEEIEERLTMMYRTSPSDLDRPIGKNEENTLLDFQTDANISQAGDKMDNDVLGKVLRLLSGELTPREDQVIRLRFGIDEKRDYTLNEIGKASNVSREYIRQIQEKALRKLRLKMRRDKIKYEDFMS